MRIVDETRGSTRDGLIRLIRGCRFAWGEAAQPVSRDEVACILAAARGDVGEFPRAAFGKRNE